jgi:hypothetical protein
VARFCAGRGNLHHSGALSRQCGSRFRPQAIRDRSPFQDVGRLAPHMMRWPGIEEMGSVATIQAETPSHEPRTEKASVVRR